MGDLELIEQLVAALVRAINSADEWCNTACGLDNAGLEVERTVVAYAHGYLNGKCAHV